MIQEILDRGWTTKSFERLPKHRTFYEKGNYWLFFDEGLSYSSGPFIEISVRDPSQHATEIGDNITHYTFSFKWKGKETIDSLDQLLF